MAFSFDGDPVFLLLELTGEMFWVFLGEIKESLY